MSRQFFILAFEDDSDAHYVTRKENPDRREFTSLDLMKCKYFEGPLPQQWKLFVSQGPPADYLANPDGLPILSERFLGLVIDLIKSDVQILDPPLFDEKTGRPVSGYKLLNILRWVKAVDLEKSTVSRGTIAGKEVLNVINFVFCTDLIPSDVHIFRPEESFPRVVVSEEFVARIKGKLTDYALIDTRSV